MRQAQGNADTSGCFNPNAAGSAGRSMIDGDITSQRQENMVGSTKKVIVLIKLTRLVHAMSQDRLNPH